MLNELKLDGDNYDIKQVRIANANGLSGFHKQGTSDPVGDTPFEQKEVCWQNYEKLELMFPLARMYDGMVQQFKKIKFAEVMWKWLGF